MKPKTFLPLSLRNMRNEHDQRERKWNALQRSRGPEPIKASEILGDFPATSDPATSLYRQFSHDLIQKFEDKDKLSVDAFEKYKSQIESLYEAELLKPKHFESLMNLLHKVYQFPRLQDQVAINKKSNKPFNYGGNRGRKTRRRSSRRKTHRKRRVTRKTRRRSSRRKPRKRRLTLKNAKQ